MPDDPWAVTVETWEGPIICCAAADEFSLRDWLRNVLSGSNLVPQGGIGAFVARRLGEGLDIRLATPVDARGLGRSAASRWRRARGTITRGSAIVTVSTGVLGAGAIAFDPPLPAADAGGDPCAADGAGDEGGVARHRAGPAGPAAALLGRSPGEAQRRSHHGVPVLALQTRLRAGLGRRSGRLGTGARRRGGGGGFRPRPVALAVRRPGGPAVRRRRRIW